MRFILVALFLSLAACGDNTLPERADAGFSVDGSTTADATISPDAERTIPLCSSPILCHNACSDVRNAYYQLATACGLVMPDGLYSSVPGNPTNCNKVVGITRADDVAFCIQWLQGLQTSCPEIMHDNWTPTANCLDLFVSQP